MRFLSGINQALEWSAARQAGPLKSADADAVAAIIESVRLEGDTAVERLTREFDSSAASSLMVPAGDMASAHSQLEPELLAAVRLSVSRVSNYYSQQVEQGFSFSEGDSSFAMLVRPLDSVACYVPAGQAPLFSTLIMTAV